MVAASAARRRIACALAFLTLTTATACSGGERETSAPGGPSPVGPAVVASTDVWGSIAESVAGGDIRVSSLVSGATDPHSFEPSPAAAAEITDATLVVFNGGGYDAWVPAVLANNPTVPAVDAYSLLDAAAIGEPSPANEHVFYEINTARAVADRIAAALADADPGNADVYRSRAASFARRADTVVAKQQALREELPGAQVVATEPVAHYLLLATGVTDRTPPGFASAIEQDTDPAPVDIAAMLDLITTRQVSALLFNDQTATAATRGIRDAANAAGVPVVEVTETLPAGSDYLGWQSDTVDRLGAALREQR